MTERLEVVPFEEIGLDLSALQENENRFAKATEEFKEASIVKTEKAVRFHVSSPEFAQAKYSQDLLNNEIMDLKDVTNTLLNDLETEIQDNDDLDPVSKALYGSIFSFKPTDFKAGNHQEAAEHGYHALTTILNQLKVEGQPILAGNISLGTDVAKLNAINKYGSHLIYLTSDEPVSLVSYHPKRLNDINLKTESDVQIPLIGNDNRSNVDHLISQAENNNGLVIGNEAVLEKIKNQENIVHIASVLVLNSAGFNYSDKLNTKEKDSIKDTLLKAFMTPTYDDDIVPGHGPKLTKRTIQGLCVITDMSLYELHNLIDANIREKLTNPDTELGQIRAYTVMLDGLRSTMKYL